MKAFWKTLLHAAASGGITGLATYNGGPITTRTTLLPAGVSALYAILAYLSKSPLQQSK